MYIVRKHIFTYFIVTVPFHVTYIHSLNFLYNLPKSN